jgi:hypothetical protein
MNLSSKLTNDERVTLRMELVALEARIRKKIMRITWTHQKLPYERLAKGRRLKEVCLEPISLLDAGNDGKLQEYLYELRKSGVKI